VLIIYLTVLVLSIVGLVKMINVFREQVYNDEKKYVQIKSVFFNEIPEMFDLLNQTPHPLQDQDLVNIHYTLCDVSQGRTFSSQKVFPFDIDGMDITRKDAYINVFFEVTDLDRERVAIICSGNGLHFIVGTTFEWFDPQYFQEKRDVYKYLCKKLDSRFAVLGLPGKMDTAIWAPNHLLRLPMTKNIKESGTTNCYFIQPVLRYITDLTLEKIAQIEEEDKYIDTKVLNRVNFSVDDNAILTKCGFINWCKENQEEVNESQWFSLASILNRVENGRELFHEYSQNHPKYTATEADLKLDHAAKHIHMCSTIAQKFEGCVECPHYPNNSSPITLKDEGFLSTKESGFRKILIKKDGSIEYGPVNYEELVIFYTTETNFINREGTVFSYTGKFWELNTNTSLEVFAEKYIKECRNTHRIEFRAKIRTSENPANLKNESWYIDSTLNKINLNNGVLDLSGEFPVLLPHSKDFFFEYCLPHDYNPEQKCPRFDVFLDEVTQNNEKLKNILMEYIGYSLVYPDNRLEKALFLLGEGSNGKTAFIRAVQSVMTTATYTNLTLKDMANDQKCFLLQGKLLNITEEAGTGMSPEAFKNLVSGGSISVKVVYEKPYVIFNRTKFIASANKMPFTHDNALGYYRRYIIVPFKEEFSLSKGNIDIDLQDKFNLELGGILNRFIEAAINLKKRGYFIEDASSEDTKEEYKIDNNHVYAFSREKLVIDTSNTKILTNKALFTAYLDYCEENGIRNRLTNNSLMKSLMGCRPDIKNLKTRSSKIKGFENLIAIDPRFEGPSAF